jgi:sulfate transport system permease protein
MLRTCVVAYVLLLVALPLAALVQQGLAGGLDGLWRVISSPTALDALEITLITAGIMAVINAVMGTATAWALVRYRFPGRGFLSAMVDLPFAIPTLVAGVMLVILYGPQSVFGAWLQRFGNKVVFATPAIILALLFVSAPFVVRAVEPVILELDPAEEEAAHTLGANDVTTFSLVSLPPLLPVILSGTIRSFARALGEFGSIVVVSGNIPHRTLTAPVYLFGELESGQIDAAAALSILLLAIALALVFVAKGLERIVGGRR